MRTIIYIFLILLVTKILTGCAQSIYTESSSTTFLFNYGDTVTTSNECKSAKNFISKCRHGGVVVGYDDNKNECYPQPQYIVKVLIDNEPAVFKYCANELILNSNPKDKQ